MHSPMLKIAFATSDRVLVDQHFGAAAGFAIYAIDGEHARLIEVTEYPQESMDGNEDKLASRIAALAGCAAVYCLAVGGSAVRQLLAGGVQPVRVETETPIEALLQMLRKAVREGGVVWIDRIVRHDSDTGRFDRMAEEGWQE
jgi:nitrogen fixation protein NifX